MTVNEWVGGLLCLFCGMMMLMTAGEDLPKMRIKNHWHGAMLGCGITALLQSSSAVSCSVCALVEGNKLRRRDAYSLLIGANIGTTATPFLTAMGFSLGESGVLFAAAGLLCLLCKPLLRRWSDPLVGFCLLMWGLLLMAARPEAFGALTENRWWSQLMTAPLGAWAVGLVTTAILQSSSLSMGLLQAYALSFGLSMQTAVPFILGQNIGTTVTALLVTASASASAKKTARFHLYFNIIGNLWALPMAVFYNGRLDFAATPLLLAIAHLSFNFLTAVLVLGCFDRPIYVKKKGTRLASSPYDP